MRRQQARSSHSRALSRLQPGISPFRALREFALFAADRASMAVELPELAISKIVSRLCEGSALQLAALAGVCRSWRTVVTHNVAENLRFDSLDTPHQLPPIECDALALKFLRAPTSSKLGFFLAAARLTSRHRGFTCTGEVVTDALIIELAQRDVHTVVIQVSVTGIDFHFLAQDTVFDPRHKYPIASIYHR